MEFSLLWSALTAALATWIGLRAWGERLPASSADRLLAATLAGLVTGRVTAMITQGTNPLTNPAELIVIRGGVDTIAATGAFVATLLWSTRRSPGAVDAMAPSILLGVAAWHGSCLWTSTCLGTPSALPWAWAQDGSVVTRHPVELYAALALAVGALFVSRLGWRLWLRSGVALSFAAGTRLLTEPLRPSLDGGPTIWYLAAVILGVLAAVAGGRLSRSPDPAPT